MNGLLKADFYHVKKSKLSVVILILAIVFPLLTVLLNVGLQAITNHASDGAAGDLFSANMLLNSVFSLTNNVGLIIPVFAGILICNDISNGTMRNKVICGNRRTEIYLSHLIVSIVFCVVTVLVYAGATAGFSAIFFKYDKIETQQFVYWGVNGVMTFVYIATVVTFFAMTFRNAAPTIIFTIVVALGLLGLTSVLGFVDTEKIKYLVYLIPTYSSSYFSIGGINMMDIFGPANSVSQSTAFWEGIASFVFFGILNTVLGIVIYNHRDIK